MNKAERAAFERAWLQFAKSVSFPKRGDESSTERASFAAGWKAALRASRHHTAAQERASSGDNPE